MGIAEIVAGMRALGAAEGLSLEEVARRVVSALMGEDAAVFRSSAGFPVVQFSDRTGAKSRETGAVLSAADRETVERAGADLVAVEDEVGRVRRARAGRKVAVGGPVRMTAEEQEIVAGLGLDPAEVSRSAEFSDMEAYRRVSAEVAGRGRVS